MVRARCWLKYDSVAFLSNGNFDMKDAFCSRGLITKETNEWMNEWMKLSQNTSETGTWVGIT